MVNNLKTMTIPRTRGIPLDIGQGFELVWDALDIVRFPPVKTKTDMVRRYSLGEFGNASPTWDTFDQWYVEVFGSEKWIARLYHIRNRVAGGPTWYNLGPWGLADKWKAITEEGVDPSTLYISAMAPLHLLNGELIRTHEGLYLFYSTVQKPMRDSLREGGREAKGVSVQFILKHYMNERSYDWTMLLLDRYPDHVIEFTVVDRCWGTVPGYNTLFWEVRSY